MEGIGEFLSFTCPCSRFWVECTGIWRGRKRGWGGGTVDETERGTMSLGWMFRCRSSERSCFGYEMQGERVVTSHGGICMLTFWIGGMQEPTTRQQQQPPKLLEAERSVAIMFS